MVSPAADRLYDCVTFGILGISRGYINVTVLIGEIGGACMFVVFVCGVHMGVFVCVLCVV